MSFSKDFKWGVATASYQIEGAVSKDGRGPSVWDMFCDKKDAVYQGQTGKVTCDHYHRYAEDVDIMKQISVQAYRMSISWPRVMPQGRGSVNQAGVDFYDRLIDELLAKNIIPYVTLFHWDLPYELFCRGGWLNNDSPQWFADYTKVIMDKFSDRVSNWMTLNEPQVFVCLGHQDGIHAPGLQYGFREVLRISHNVMLAHGRAVQTIRAHAKKTPNIGYAPVGYLTVPRDQNSPADIELARKETFAVKPHNAFNAAWWMDPIFKGHYPEQALEVYGKDAPEFTDEQMKIISEPIDFLGLNIYFAFEVYKGMTENYETAPREDGAWYTPMGWTVDPTALYWGSKFYYERYKTPIAITENGMANLDCVSEDGKVHDPQRIEFLRRYITQLKRAAKEGVDLKTYFQWSLLDNFEWAFGFSKRFGLVYVDYAAQKRIIKDSAWWYKNLIETNAEQL